MTWVAAAVGSATVTLGAVEYYNANKQKKKAEALAKENAANRPTYNIPSSIEAYMTDAQRMAAQGMPEEQRQRYLQQIARTQAYGIAANSSRGGMIQGVAQSQMAANDANANLLTMDNQQRQQNIQNLQGARLNYAGYQDKAFGYNQDMPYQQTAATIRALLGSATANENTALQTITSGVNTGVSGVGNNYGAERKNDNTNTNTNTNTNQAYTTSTPNTVQTQQQWQNSNPYGYYVPPNGAPNINYGYGTPYETQTTSAPTAGSSNRLTDAQRQALIKQLGNP